MKLKFTCLLIFLFNYLLCPAQSVQELMTTRQPQCRDVLINSSDVLSKFYNEKSFDSINVAVQIIEQFCGERSPNAMYIKTLLSIQESSFSVRDSSFNQSLDTLLNTYTFTLKTLKNNGYPINKYEYHYYSLPEKNFYQFIKIWANNLLAERKLTNSEYFICNLLAGNLTHPTATLKAQKLKYPELYALLKKNYATERSQFGPVISIISGAWLPSGNLKILGAHPSLGFQIGGRGKSNEIDLTLQFRFVNTPHKYFVFRSDSLYALNHFFGGYIGADYSHYFYHSTNFEAGLMAGMGYDGFDIYDPPKKDDNKSYLKPYSIGSLNLNAGLRANYFFNPRLFIGVAAKYNGISYSNRKGSSLSGHPVSIDLIIGG